MTFYVKRFIIYFFREDNVAARKKSYRQARMQRQSGRFDTWSSPLTSNSIIAEAVAKFSKRKNSIINYNTQDINYYDKHDEYNNQNEHIYDEDYSTTSSSKFSNNRRRRVSRRPLSELWRFKSEIQLNFSKKVF